jgi:hypothetical protein
MWDNHPRLFPAMPIHGDRRFSQVNGLLVGLAAPPLDGPPVDDDNAPAGVRL